MNPRVPAVSRWWERESEVLASPPQLEYTSPLPEVAVLSRPAGKSLPTASAASFGNEGFAGPRSFNEVFTVWRLISGNHRELARGAGMFTSYAVAAAHAQSISGAVSGLSVTLVKHPDTGGYGWYASLGSQPVLLTPTWQRSARDRDRSLATALGALGGAKILATVARHGHRHLTGSFVADFASDSPNVHFPLQDRSTV